MRKPANILRNAISDETITKKNSRNEIQRRGLNAIFFCLRGVSRTMPFNPYSAATRSSIPSVGLCTDRYSVIDERAFDEEKNYASVGSAIDYLMLMLRYLMPSDCPDHDRSVFAAIVFP